MDPRIFMPCLNLSAVQPQILVRMYQQQSSIIFGHAVRFVSTAKKYATNTCTSNTFVQDASPFASPFKTCVS